MQKSISFKQDLKLNDSHDVIVIGGGPSGCAAAAASAREGANTLLIESSSALGGMGTQGLVPWFGGYNDGEKIIAGGFAEFILDECCKGTPHYQKEMCINDYTPPFINPELLKRIYDNLVCESGAEVLFQTNFSAVKKKEADEISAIITSNKAGLCAYQAAVYIDCTGDGDVAVRSGAGFEKGDSTGQLQPATHCFIITNVDEKNLENGPDIHFFDKNSPVWKAIKSENYPDIIDLHSCYIKIGPKTYSFNTGHIFDADNTDPKSLTKALLHGRKLVSQYHQAFVEYHHAFANSFLVATGSLMGIRETRRIIGDYVLKKEDYLERKSFSDEICRTANIIDVHQTKEEAIRLTGMSIEQLKAEFRTHSCRYEKGESYGIPYRCLTPKNLKNIIVAGRCISTDRQTNGSIRLMATCLNTGEAAGIAAALSAKESQNVHEIDTKKLRNKLKSYGAHLPDASFS